MSSSLAEPSSPPNDLPPRPSQCHRRNYFRIWESPSSEVLSPQDVCNQNYSEVSQDHNDLKEDESLGTVLRGLFRQAPLVSPNPLPNNVNDQRFFSPVLVTNVYNGRNTSVSPMTVPQGFLSTPHRPPPSSSNNLQHSHLTEGLHFFSSRAPSHPSNQSLKAPPPRNARVDETDGFNDTAIGGFYLRDEAGPSEPSIIHKYIPLRTENTVLLIHPTSKRGEVLDPRISHPSKLVTPKIVSSARPSSQKVSFTESSSEAEDHVYETLGTKRQCNRESYSCDLCKRIFSRELELKVHRLSRGHQSRIKRHYGTDTFVCTQCSYTGNSPEEVVFHYGYSHSAQSSAPSLVLSKNTERQPSASIIDPPDNFELNSSTKLTSCGNFSVSVLVNCKTISPLARSFDRKIASRKSQPLPNVPGKSHVTNPNVAPPSKMQLDDQPLPVTEHDGTTRYACTVCDITLNRPSDLFRHYRSTRHRVACGESVVPQYECPHCQLVFSRTDAVKRHMARSCRKRYVEIS